MGYACSWKDKIAARRIVQGGETPLKRVLLPGLLVLILVACFVSAVKSDLLSFHSNSSLLPFNTKWTATQVQDRIAMGAEVDATDDRGMTALMWAAACTDALEVIEVLITAGADVNARMNDGRTPLIFLAGNNHDPEATKALIAAGAEVDRGTDYGETPLMSAAGGNSNPEVIKVLLAEGAEVNARTSSNLTPLMWAAKYGENPEVIRVLLNAGADGRIRSFEGKTAFDYARDNPNVTGTDVYWLLCDAQF